MKSNDNIHLTRLQADQLMRLLTVLDVHIESAMESVIVPASGGALHEDADELQHRIDGKDREAIRTFIRLLEGR